jgi:leucyl-tRNA---protein transferase
MNHLPLWLSAPQLCSYLPQRDSQPLFIAPEVALNMALYSQLIDLGFRRSGDYVYRPHCTACTSCIATRIAVDNFLPNRSQRRCRQHHAATRVVVRNAEFDPRHFELYCRYQNARHGAPEHNSIDAEQYWQFMGSSWCTTLLLEFLHQGRLMAVAVTDRVEQGLSAMYTFFDPELSALSPGVFALLWQIEYARQLDLDFVYPGFWVRDCRKMSYKMHYRPLQGYVDGQWQTLPKPDHYA